MKTLVNCSITDMIHLRERERERVVLIDSGRINQDKQTSNITIDLGLFVIGHAEILLFRGKLCRPVTETPTKLLIIRPFDYKFIQSLHLSAIRNPDV